MKERRRAGFVHNDAQLALFVVLPVAAFLVPFFLGRHWKLPSIALLLVVGILWIVASIGEVKLFLSTKHKHHLITPIALIIAAVILCCLLSAHGRRRGDAQRAGEPVLRSPAEAP
jgi:hypothetical protein